MEERYSVALSVVTEKLQYQRGEKEVKFAGDKDWWKEWGRSWRGKKGDLGRGWLTLIRTNLLVPQCGFHSRADSRSWFSQDRLFGSSSELPWYLQGCPNLALLPRLHSVCGLSIFLSVLTCDPSTGKTQTYSEGLLNSRFELAVAERVFGPGLVSWVNSCQWCLEWGGGKAGKETLVTLSGPFFSAWNYMLLSPVLCECTGKGKGQTKDVAEDNTVGTVRKAAPGLLPLLQLCWSTSWHLCFSLPSRHEFLRATMGNFLCQLD